MKIARSVVILAFMSSFLVLGFESEDASATSERRHEHVTTAAGSDTWQENPVPADVRAEDGRSSAGVGTGRRAPSQFAAAAAAAADDNDDDDDGVDDVDDDVTAASERLLQSSENVITGSEADSDAPESGRTAGVQDARSSHSSESVIHSVSRDTMSPSNDRSHPAAPPAAAAADQSPDYRPASSEAQQQQQQRRRHLPAGEGDDDDGDAQPSLLSQLSKREREQLLRSLEASFLKIVGLRSRPRPSSHVTIPQFMKELYARQTGSRRPKGRQRQQRRHQQQQQQSLNRGTLHNSNTIRSFFHTEDDEKHPENVVRLKFNITSFPGDELLRAAELRLYREAVIGPRRERKSPTDRKYNATLDELARQRHRIDVYQVLDPGSRPSGSGAGGSAALTRLIDTRLVDPGQSGWETFDVTPALESWRTAENHGLEVRFSKASGEPSPLQHVRLKRSAKPVRRHGRSRDGQPQRDDDWDEKKPLLVTYSQDSAGGGQPKDRRNKRNTDRKKGRRKRSKKNRGKRRKDRPRKDRDYKRDCRRRALYVDFHDVGWTDWIVAPPGYDAFYCYGECPFHMSDHFNTTNHAVVQQFVHSVDPQAVPKPCCVPTELGQLALLYIDEQGKVVLKNYDEMVVEACGCR